MSLSWGASEAVIVGFGQTAMTFESGTSEYQLALNAVDGALSDAGVSYEDVDGLVTFDMDSTEPYYLAEGLGFDRIRYAAKSSFGGGGGSTAFMLAATAVAAGNADCVVVYRAINGQSTTRYGQPISAAELRHYYPFTADYGLVVPGHRFALGMHRVLHELGITNENLAPLCVQQRKYAASNPNAVFYKKPITIDQHQSSPWITEPVLRRLDCCLETDGGAAFVITRKEFAKKTAKNPVRIRACAAGMVPGIEIPGEGLFNQSKEALPNTRIVAEELWRLSGLSPKDIDAAILYDHFSPFALLQLEAFGFCGTGQSADFVRSGGIALDGELPMNMNGGQLGEGYIHGMNGMTEAIRQLRGDAVNQVKSPKNILVSAGPGIPTSGLILSVD